MEEKTEFLHVRIGKNELAKFKDKTNKTGKTLPVMIRELVSAYNDDRLKITPTEDQAKGLRLYEGE